MGDVLDNLNGIHICAATKGRLESILRVARGQPISIALVKAKYSDTNELFPGIITLLKKVKVDVQAVRNGSNLNSTDLSKSDLKTVR